MTAVGLSFFVVAAFDWPESGEAARLPTCRTLDSGAVGFRRYIVALDTGTTQKAAEDRAFWHIRAVAAGDILFVTDSISCVLSARRHEATVNRDTVNPYPVHLLKVGSNRFIAFNYTKRGGWFHYVVLDSNFSLVGTRGS